MSPRSGVRLAVVVVAAPALVGCGIHTCHGFALSLTRTTGGAATPVDAAEDFAARASGPELPDDGWREDGRDAAGAHLSSGRSTVHAVQGTDGTWFVDGGETCD